MEGAAWHISEELPFEPAGPEAAGQAAARTMASDGADVRLRRAFECCGDDLYRFIVVRVRGDRHVADDLLQQTCYEAARRRRIPNGDDAAQAWLFGIARNLTRKHFRQLRRNARVRSEEAAARTMQPMLEATDRCSGAAGQSDMAAQLLTAIAALNQSDQQLILESYFENRSHEQLARAAGVSVRAIEGRLYRARAALRAALNALSGEHES